jgi:hypothetical protein
MNRRLARIALATGLSAIGLLSIAAPASANIATIGSALAVPMDVNGICLSNCVSLQQAQVGGSSPNPLSSPANGIVTQWAVRSSDSGARYSLRILRPAGPNTYTGAGTAVAPSSLPDSTDRTYRYPASLAIKQGDSIGISLGGDSDAGLPQAFTNGVPANVIANNFSGQPADGATAAFIPDQQHELLVQATVQFCSVPSLKRFKKTTAKQLLAAADCGVKVKKRVTHKRKFRGKVLKQKVPPGTTAAPGTVVPIVIGQK